MLDWSDSSVLITGGTGSFGRTFVKLMLREHRPRRLIVYSRDEWKQHCMRREGFDDPAMRYFLGDVRDRERLRRAMDGVDVVVHAAALKQVPACEYNPIEAVATNINGACNVIDACIDQRVPYAINLSTDKATAPLNIYGATKLVAEKLFVQANAYTGDPRQRFACVRYGNVLASRGSVVPLFREQARSGVVTVTDDRMTRFWISLEQSVRFVISCLEMMCGGEVFIPRLPSMRIVDLAAAVAPGCTIETIGIRAGEKLHESLVSADEARQTVDLGDRYIMLPGESLGHPSEWSRLGTPLPPGCAYSSDSNDWWLTSDEILELLGDAAPTLPRRAACTIDVAALQRAAG